MRDGAERHLWALALLLGQRGSTSWELPDGIPIDAHAHLLALVGLMGPDLDEAIIAAAADREASMRRRNAIHHSRIRSRCVICGAQCGAPCREPPGHEHLIWSLPGGHSFLTDGYILHVNGRMSNA